MNSEKIHTFCRLCESACGLVAEVKNEKVVSLQPDKDHPIHKGFSCNKGPAFLEVHNDPDRLNTPLRRVDQGTRNPENSAFEPVGWDSAISDIATRLTDIKQQYGDNSVAIYFGVALAYMSSSLTTLAMLEAIGVKRRFGPSTQDVSSKMAASEEMFGSKGLFPFPDLLRTDYFLNIGSNPAVSHLSAMEVSNPMEKIKAIKDRGGIVRFINPRHIESATPSTGDVTLITPDTDFYFLAGLLHEILFNIGFDRETTELKGKNIDGLIDFVSQYPIKRIAPVTGIDAQTIRQIANEFCAAPAASIYMSTGVNQGRQGALAHWMLNMISLVTGNMGKPGGNVYSPCAFPMVKMLTPVAGDTYTDSPYGDYRLGMDLPGALMADMLESDDEPIRALIILGGNPLLSVPGEERLRKALNKVELMVSTDIYRNATSELADYILPATDWLENDGGINLLHVYNGGASEPYIQYSPPIVPAKAERRDDWWIVAKLAQELDVVSEEPNPQQAIDALLGNVDLSTEKLMALPTQTAVLDDFNPNNLFTVGIQHEDGLIDCCPTVFKRGYQRAEDILKELEGEDKNQLKLISRRTHYMINTVMQNVPSLKVAVHQTNPLWMHSYDAKQRGLFDGDQVLISNAYGSIEATLRFDEGLKPGAVSMTHGWGNKRTRRMKVASQYAGANFNAIAPNGPGSYDPISNQSHTTGFNVDVCRY